MPFFWPWEAAEGSTQDRTWLCIVMRISLVEHFTTAGIYSKARHFNPKVLVNCLLLKIFPHQYWHIYEPLQNHVCQSCSWCEWEKMSWDVYEFYHIYYYKDKMAKEEATCYQCQMYAEETVSFRRDNRSRHMRNKTYLTNFCLCMCYCVIKKMADSQLC